MFFSSIKQVKNTFKKISRLSLFYDSICLTRFFKFIYPIIGLLELIKIRKELNSNPLTIFGPEELKTWIHFYHNEVESLRSDFVLRFNHHFVSHLKNKRTKNFFIYVLFDVYFLTSSR